MSGRRQMGEHKQAIAAIGFVVHVGFLLCVVVLWWLLSCRDPSTVDDSLITCVFWVLGGLGLPVVALVGCGARPGPAVSAVFPLIVIACLPWRDIHSAALPTLIWMLVHVSVVLGVWRRRPRARSVRELRRASSGSKLDVR